jgi:hypothetical protein
VHPQVPSGLQHASTPTGKQLCVHAGMHVPPRVGRIEPLPLLPPEPELPADPPLPAVEPALPAVPASVIVTSPGSGSGGFGAAQRVHSVA